MYLKTFRTILLIAALATGISSCTKDRTKDTSCATCPVTSFKTDIVPIFTQSCAMTACHTGQFPAGNINLDPAVAYAQVTVQGKGYVNAGNPSTSILYGQLFAGATNHMPNNGQQLDPCDIQKIYCWINEGALNN